MTKLTLVLSRLAAVSAVTYHRLQICGGRFAKTSLMTIVIYGGEDVPHRFTQQAPAALRRVAISVAPREQFGGFCGASDSTRDDNPTASVGSKVARQR